jgi:hypothetical protein
MNMKKTKLTNLIHTFNNLRKMGIKVNFGSYCDELDVKLMDSELYNEGVWFTRRQIVDAVHNGGLLRVKDSNDEGILEIELKNQLVTYHKGREGLIIINLYKTELKELYELSKEIRQEWMEQKKDTEVPK